VCGRSSIPFARRPRFQLHRLALTAEVVHPDLALPHVSENYRQPTTIRGQPVRLHATQQLRHCGLGSTLSLPPDQPPLEWLSGARDIGQRAIGADVYLG
jgi:hypothetical protein